MHTLMIAAIAALTLTAGTLTALAGTELDRAMGAGSYVHPTGPAHGVWNGEAGTHQGKN